MDKMIYTAMNAAQQTLNHQAVISNNLANVSTSGFRGQLASFQALPVEGAGALPTRVSVLASTPGTNAAPGPLMSTGRELDVAMEDDGWLAIQTADGSEAYTRRGDLRIDGNGVMLSGGHPVLGNGGPIIIPLGAQAFIGADGTISVQGEGQPPNSVVQVGRLKLVTPGEEVLERGGDGLFRMTPGPDGEQRVLPMDEDVRVTTGMLEGSNVSAIDSMVAMIDNARRYDMQMKFIEDASENAQRGNNLLSLR